MPRRNVRARAAVPARPRARRAADNAREAGETGASARSVGHSGATLVREEVAVEASAQEAAIYLEGQVQGATGEGSMGDEEELSVDLAGPQDDQAAGTQGATEGATVDEDGAAQADGGGARIMSADRGAAPARPRNIFFI